MDFGYGKRAMHIPNVVALILNVDLEHNVLRISGNHLVALAVRPAHRPVLERVEEDVDVNSRSGRTRKPASASAILDHHALILVNKGTQLTNVNANLAPDQLRPHGFSFYATSLHLIAVNVLKGKNVGIYAAKMHLVKITICAAKFPFNAEEISLIIEAPVLLPVIQLTAAAKTVSVLLSLCVLVLSVLMAG
jgi:hypothetical protein